MKSPILSTTTLLLPLLPFLSPKLPQTLAYTPLSDQSLLNSIPPRAPTIPDEQQHPTPNPNPNQNQNQNTHSDAPHPEEDFDPLASPLLAPLLVPRVPGTPGHAAVQRHFAAFVREHLHPGWAVEWHNATALTPRADGDGDGDGGRGVRVGFANLVLRRDPPWAAGRRKGEGEGEGREQRAGKGEGDVARLTLAAHYDSLYRPEGFVGAVDSAVPCAVLLYVAKAIDPALTKRWEGMMAERERRKEETDDNDGLEDLEDDEGEEEKEKGVQILLLDGEEAWVQWSESDSLYGSRALAEKWEATMYEEGSAFSTPLEAISLFVLLDLLGAPEPNIPSYFPKTHWAYQRLATIEERLRKLGVLETKPKRPFLAEGKKEARELGFRGYIADDHVPFMRRGVDILHLIPTPFPPVWHTMDDDAAHLDVPTIRDWARIMTAFVAEWMDLEGYLPENEGGKGKQKEGSRPSEKDEL